MESELPIIALKELAGNDLPTLNTFQHVLVPYLGGIINAWWALWFVILLLVIRYTWVHGTTREDT
ncbi:hypothetical protein EXS56_01585 [Candidatus Kaiserbacteria bacterium]|nr:hypothetical protein [Candidatus Kaiserbacteria bacterium]